MSKALRLVALAGLVGIAAVAIPRASPSAPAAAADAGNQPDRGRFQVAAGQDACLLCETATGKTWILQRSKQSLPVWLPIKRIDSEQEAVKWQLIEKERDKPEPDPRR